MLHPQRAFLHGAAFLGKMLVLDCLLAFAQVSQLSSSNSVLGFHDSQHSLTILSLLLLCL